jgi:hypothetical protein
MVLQENGSEFDVGDNGMNVDDGKGTDDCDETDSDDETVSDGDWAVDDWGDDAPLSLISGKEGDGDGMNVDDGKRTDDCDETVDDWGGDDWGGDAPPSLLIKPPTDLEDKHFPCIYRDGPRFRNCFIPFPDLEAMVWVS